MSGLKKIYKPYVAGVPGTPGVPAKNPTVGHFEPGTPGIPPTPPFCLDVPTLIPLFRYSCLLHDERGNCLIWQQYPNGFETINVETCYPGSPGQPPTPPVWVPGEPGTPGVPGVPGIPAQPANYYLGWNAGADSVQNEPLAAGDFEYVFSASANAVGIVTGIGPKDNTGGYQRIPHGIYISNGTFQVIESGVRKTDPQDFSDGDSFFITRRGTRVDYYWESTAVYRSTVAAVGTLNADGEAYMGQDQIYTARLVPLDAVHSVEAGQGHGAIRGPVGFGVDSTVTGSAAFCAGQIEYLTVDGHSADDPINGITGIGAGIIRGPRAFGLEFGVVLGEGIIPGPTVFGEDYGVLHPQYAIGDSLIPGPLGFGVASGFILGVCDGLIPGPVGFGIAHNATDFFLDNFTGAGDLSSHSPDDGGSYFVVGAGSLADYPIGGGVIPSSTSGTEVAAPFASDPGSIYTVTETFTPTAAGADTATLDLKLTDATGTIPYIDVALVWNGATWDLVVTVYDNTGAVIFTQTVDVTGDVTVGASNNIEITVWPNGVSVSLNGTIEVSTNDVPGSAPGSPTVADSTPAVVAFINEHSGGTSNINLTEIEGQQLAPSGVEGYLNGFIPGLIAYGSDVNRGWMVGELEGPYPFLGIGHQAQGIVGFKGKLPRGVFTGSGHASAELKQPRGVFSATATLVNFGEMIGSMPSGVFFASGDMSDLARMIGRAPRGVFSGSGHAVLAAKQPRGAFTGAGHFTTIGRMVAPRGFHGLFSGTGHWDNFGIAIGILPVRLVPVAVGRAALLVEPRGRFVGLGHWGDATVYEGYSLTFLQAQDPNQVALAASHYTNYPFDRIVRWRGHYYGIAPTGIYLLEGELFDQEPIVARVALMESAFGHEQRKRTRALFLTGEIGDDMALDVTTNELEDVVYTYTQKVREGARVHRFKLGRGMAGTEIAFSFTNSQGLPFRISKVTPEVEVLKRVIGG